MSEVNTLRVAAAQYNIEWLADWAAYQTKLERWFSEAARQRAQFLVFPEYFSMELASLFGERTAKSLAGQLEAMQEVLPQFLALFERLAREHNVYAVAGSYPVAVRPTVYRNRAYLFHPDGRQEFQEKLQMTRFENEQWHVSRGDAVKVFDTRYGKVGINICYDSEFPIIARRQVEVGANLIVVPSCTDTLAGYHRVRIGCQARALENQCYVVQSPTVGDAPWSEAVDVNIGAAAVYTPVDYGFPADGVLAIGELNQSCWVYADLDLGAIETIRNTGQVFNYRDWPSQFRFD